MFHCNVESDSVSTDVHLCSGTPDPHECLSTADRNDRYLLLLGRIHGNSYTISVISCHQRNIGMATVHQKSNLPRFLPKQDTDLV